MNTTGCPPYYAVDNFFVPRSGSENCGLFIPVFVAVLEFYALIHFGVAVTRTVVIRRNMRTRKVRESSTVNAIIPWITLAQSWMTFFAVALTPAVWVLFSPAGFMYSICAVLFGISAEMWLAKLIRLGAKIIPRSNISLGGDSSHRMIFDALAKSDTLLTVVAYLTRTALTLQLVCGLILYLALGDPATWLQVTMGLQAFATGSWVLMLDWQYLRCERAIKQVSALVNVVKPDPEASNKELDSVLRKMREHRYILSALGLPGVTMFALWAGGIYTTSWWVMLLIEFFDTATNGVVLFTFVRRRQGALSRSNSKDQRPHSIHPSSNEPEKTDAMRTHKDILQSTTVL